MHRHVKNHGTSSMSFVRHMNLVILHMPRVLALARVEGWVGESAWVGDGDEEVQRLEEAVDLAEVRPL